MDEANGGGRRGDGLIASGGGKIGHTEERVAYGALQMGLTSRQAYKMASAR